MINPKFLEDKTVKIIEVRYFEDWDNMYGLTIKVDNEIYSITIDDDAWVDDWSLKFEKGEMM